MTNLCNAMNNEDPGEVKEAEAEAKVERIKYIEY